MGKTVDGIRWKYGLTNDKSTENPNIFVKYDKLLDSSQFFGTFVATFSCGFHLSLSPSTIPTIEAISCVRKKKISN